MHPSSALSDQGDFYQVLCMGCEHPSPKGRWWICKVPVHLPFISRDARATCCTVKACGVTPCSFLIWHLLKECFQDCSSFCFNTNLLRIYADWTHSQHVICCQKQRFELSAEGHVSKKMHWAETLLLCCYTQHTGIRFGFVLFFNMQLTDPNLISFWLSMCWLWRRSILKGTSTGTQWSMLWILIQIMTFGSSTILHALPGSAAPPLPCLWPHFTSSSPPVLSSTVRWGRGLISNTQYTRTEFGCGEFVSVGPIYRLHRRSNGVLGSISTSLPHTSHFCFHHVSHTSGQHGWRGCDLAPVGVGF